MALPLFYNKNIQPGDTMHVLNEETSSHIVQVLRMQVGEQVHITNGKGNLFLTELTDPHKKKAAVKILSATFIKARGKKISIAISLLKNTSRFEWFLEKATEIGVNEIIPIICARTEKQHFRFDRMEGILISAMLQSQQVWLPVLHEPVKFDKLMQKHFPAENKFIAHCEKEENKIKLSGQSTGSSILLIGPEGDFTHTEIEEAVKNNYIPVTLGNTRLRTETAGMAGAVMLCNP